MSMLGHHKQQREPVQPGWMITFADLLALLLTFFVLLFSMNTVQYESWKAVVNTMADEFNQNRPKIALEEKDSSDHLTPSASAGLNLNYLRVLLERSIGNHASFEGVTVYRLRDRVVISIPADLIFKRKDTVLLAGAVRPLETLAGTLAQIKNKVQIAGHTDPAPIINGKFRSNWELSMARARIVAGILTKSGYKKPMTVLGFADTGNAFKGKAPKPAALVKAERVDIVIVSESRQEGLYDLF